jgi:hypothetical protein
MHFFHDYTNQQILFIKNNIKPPQYYRGGYLKCEIFNISRSANLSPKQNRIAGHWFFAMILKTKGYHITNYR